MNRRRSAKRLIAISTAGAMALGAIAVLWWRAGPPAPAGIDRLDPLVADAVRTALWEARKRPWDIDAWRTLGLVYEANEAPELAAECYEHVLARRPHDARTWYRLACATEQAGETREALLKLDKAIELDSRYCPLHWKRGWWLLDLGETESAQQSFGAALNIDPEDRAVAAGLGVCLLQSNQAQQAISTFERLLVQQDDRYIRRLLGNAYLQAGRADDARRELRRAGQAMPRWIDPWSNEMAAHITGIAVTNASATDLMNAGDAAAAIKLLVPLTRRCPDHVMSVCNLGRAFGQLNRFDEALRCFEQARQIDPHSAHARAGLAAVSQAQGNYDQALQWIDEAIELNGTSAQGRLSRGMILLHLRRTSDAVEEFERAFALQPDNAAALIWKGRGQLILNDWQGAETTFLRAIDVHETSAAAFGGLAEAQFRQGRTTEALASLETALRLNPNEPGLANVLRLIQQ